MRKILAMMSKYISFQKIYKNCKKIPLFVAKGLKEGNHQGTTWGQY
jgi:hypothetical protein